jgi:hypothetical protein
LDKRGFFKEGAIALEALSETTNGDADSVVMNPACQLPKFFEAQPTADSPDEKSGLACTGAASRQQFFPGLIPNIADCLHDLGPCQRFPPATR